MGNYQRAQNHLVAALDIITSKRQALAKQAPRKLKHLNRIYEEWAEVAAKTGRLQQAVAFEQKRVMLLKKFPKDSLRSQPLADAYQGLAARMAAAGRIEQSLPVYRQGLSLWSERAKNYPDDIRPRQGMAGIYAELSKWHAKLANQANDQEKSAEHRQQSCFYLQRSQQVLHSLPKSSTGFGIRYSWLQNPAQLIQSLSKQCG